ncbi:MAG: hypothetical protein M5R40_07260 [Anaerolineae bacterium]|nr:hypothetical protein [Anaerolineae bacterium]
MPDARTSTRKRRKRGRLPQIPHSFGAGELGVAAAMLARAVADAEGVVFAVYGKDRKLVAAEARAWLTEAGIEFAEALGVEGLLQQWLRER